MAAPDVSLSRSISLRQGATSQLSRLQPKLSTKSGPSALAPAAGDTSCSINWVPRGRRALTHSAAYRGGTPPPQGTLGNCLQLAHQGVMVFTGGPLLHSFDVHLLHTRHRSVSATIHGRRIQLPIAICIVGQRPLFVLEPPNCASKAIVPSCRVAQTVMQSEVAENEAAYHTGILHKSRSRSKGRESRRCQPLLTRQAVKGVFPAGCGQSWSTCATKAGCQLDPPSPPTCSELLSAACTPAPLQSSQGATGRPAQRVSAQLPGGLHSRLRQTRLLGRRECHAQ